MEKGCSTSVVRQEVGKRQEVELRMQGEGRAQMGMEGGSRIRRK